MTLIDPGLEMPYTQQWNLTIERQMPFASAFRASYTGNRGIGLLKYALDNLPVHDPVNGVLVANHPNNPANLRGKVIRLGSRFSLRRHGGNHRDTVYGAVSRCRSDRRFLNTASVCRAQTSADRTVSTGTNLAVSNAAWSYYHAMQLEWTKRLSSNLNFQAAYTWSKAIDTTSEATFVGAGDSNQNGNNARDARALSRFHTPHRFTATALTVCRSLMATKGFAWARLLAGWQFSAVVKLAKGTPFTVTTTALDLNFDGFAESSDRYCLIRRCLARASTIRYIARRAAAFGFRTLTVADFNASLLGRNTFFLDGVQDVRLRD